MKMTTQSDEEEALRWAARTLSGDMTGDERAALQSWLSASHAHREAFSAATASLPLLDEIALEAATRLGAAEMESLAAVEAATSAAANANAPRRFGRMAAAAVFLVAAGAIAFANRPVADAPILVAAAVGAQQHETLADGSALHLNSGTRIEVAYSRDARTTHLLGGEALFDVSKDAGRPFTVVTADAEIVVTGTSFNVLALPRRTEVAVVSGTVEVTPLGGATIRLSAGEALSILDGAARDGVRRFETADVLAWRQGRARYRNAPLSAVVADLNRYFERPIALADPALGELPVTGEFDVTDQGTAVAALAVAFDLEPRAGVDRIVLRTANR